MQLVQILEESKPMNLKEVALEVERILIDNNITWRYASSRNARTLLLEDGTSTVITIRYDFPLDNYFIHYTKIVEGSPNLDTDYTIIYDLGIVEDVINEIIN